MHEKEETRQKQLGHRQIRNGLRSLSRVLGSVRFKRTRSVQREI